MFSIFAPLYHPSRDFFCDTGGKKLSCRVKHPREKLVGKKKDIISNDSEKHNQEQLTSKIIVGETLSIPKIRFLNF